MFDVHGREFHNKMEGIVSTASERLRGFECNPDAAAARLGSRVAGGLGGKAEAGAHGLAFTDAILGKRTYHAISPYHGHAIVARLDSLNSS